MYVEMPVPNHRNFEHGVQWARPAVDPLDEVRADGSPPVLGSTAGWAHWTARPEHVSKPYKGVRVGVRSMIMMVRACFVWDEHASSGCSMLHCFEPCVIVLAHIHEAIIGPMDI